MNDITKDLLGNPLTETEQELLRLTRKLQDMAARDDLPPCALMNVRQALVMLWNACNDLDLVDGEPDAASP